jgi:hypothetical protein
VFQVTVWSSHKHAIPIVAEVFDEVIERVGYTVNNGHEWPVKSVERAQEEREKRVEKTVSNAIGDGHEWPVKSVERAQEEREKRVEKTVSNAIGDGHEWPDDVVEVSVERWKENEKNRRAKERERERARAPQVLLSTMDAYDSFGLLKR